MKDDKKNQADNQTSTTMPEDFWEMVKSARVRAVAEVARKRQAIYKALVPEDAKKGKSIPMPNGFWQAIDGDFENLPPLSSNSEIEIASKEFEYLPSIPEIAEVPLQEDFSETLNPVMASVIAKEPVEENEANEENEQRALSFKEAALLILEREKRQMTAREIVTLAIKEGLLSSVGKTPDASLAGQIYTDIHRNKENTPFVIVGPRTYALKSQPQKVESSVITGYFPPQEEEKVPQASELSLSKKMSYKQVALHLLEREQRPMTAREIVSIAINEGLIESTGKTPDATLAGQIYTEIQHLGDRSPIKLIGPRTYALFDWYRR